MSHTFQKSFEVRWDDVDLNGHLRNTRYVEYASTARHSYLAAAGWSARSLRKEGFAPVLLGEEIQYAHEVFLAETVDVSCEVVGLSADASRWRMQHTVLREDKGTAAVVRSLGTWIDLRVRKIAAPPPSLGDFLRSECSDDCEVIG
ncbi:thioesterase family protein [Streptomyces sp. PSAA01]|uniref:acyl-CoA thioesterase n=1 Tax=Streptomyces sp. PSAA01 TaxID=2912762 RepID=UPI001F3FA845|nr:thioesterase family protein [Streptomyces sp. PSAA01]MCG0287800.1 thioesterase family protein [Streptomyces sp. PSAA01]